MQFIRILVTAVLLLPAEARSAPEAPTFPPSDTEARPADTEAQRVAKPRVTRASRRETAGEKVLVTTRHEQGLVASYFAPKTSGVAPGAILVHDAGGDRMALEELALHLQKMGFGVLTIDLRGHGESITEEHNWSRMEESARQSVWAYSLEDLESASSFLRGHREIHSANLTMVGFRAGCTLASRHAANDENVKALVLLDPRPRELGFDLSQDIAALAGLPIYIAVQKEQREMGETLVQCGTEANGGVEFMDLSVRKTREESVLEDKKVRSDVGRWVKSQVQPKRGDR